MEMYKDNTLASVYKSMEILSEFPRQVIVLKGSKKVSALRGRRSGLQRRLVDQEQTAGFPDYISQLRLAQEGNSNVQAQLLEFGKLSTSQMTTMTGNAHNGRSFILSLVEAYSKEERHAIRVGGTYTGAFKMKTIGNVMLIAESLFAGHSNVNRIPAHEIPNTYIFRATLSALLLALDWAARGGAQDANPATIRNDLVDASFSAYATYFDGLLTGDHKAARLHSETRVWLNEVCNCELPADRSESQ